MIKFIEHHDPGYPPRTIVNAWAADLTIAFATDFTTPGERLTHKAAYGKYQAVDITSGFSMVDRLDSICRFMERINCQSINIAGNGIYTLKSIYNQKDLDELIFEFLGSLICTKYGQPVIIRSGGQSGCDESGLKAGDRIGLETICLAPKNWLFRDINGKDHMHDPDAFCARFGPQYVNDI